MTTSFRQPPHVQVRETKLIAFNDRSAQDLTRSSNPSMDAKFPQKDSQFSSHSAPAQLFTYQKTGLAQRSDPPANTSIVARPDPRRAEVRRSDLNFDADQPRSDPRLGSGVHTDRRSELGLSRSSPQSLSLRNHPPSHRQTLLSQTENPPGGTSPTKLNISPSSKPRLRGILSSSNSSIPIVSSALEQAEPRRVRFATELDVISSIPPKDDQRNAKYKYSAAMKTRDRDVTSEFIPSLQMFEQLVFEMQDAKLKSLKSRTLNFSFLYCIVLCCTGCFGSPFMKYVSKQ